MAELERREARLGAMINQLMHAVDSQFEPAPGTTDDVHELATTIQTPSVRAQLFGTFHLEIDGHPINEWTGSKGQAILRYLLAQHPRAISMDVLMETFWPHLSPQRARRSLHQAVYSLRRDLEDADHLRHAMVVFANGHYSIDASVRVTSDLAEFERLVQLGLAAERQARREEMLDCFVAAMELYRSELLEDSLYEDWAHDHRESTRSRFLMIADKVAYCFLTSGRIDEAAAASSRILAFDPCHEGAHRLLMEAYTMQGHRHLAIRQYEQCVATLADHLGIGPDPITIDLRARLLDSPLELRPEWDETRR